MWLVFDAILLVIFLCALWMFSPIVALSWAIIFVLIHIFIKTASIKFIH